MPHDVLDEAVGSLANRLQQIVFPQMAPSASPTLPNALPTL